MRDSNSRPSVHKTDALPIALIGHYNNIIYSLSVLIIFLIVFDVKIFNLLNFTFFLTIFKLFSISHEIIVFAPIKKHGGKI